MRDSRLLNASLTLGENSIGLRHHDKTGEPVRRRNFKTARKSIQRYDPLSRLPGRFQMTLEPRPRRIKKFRVVSLCDIELAEPRQRYRLKIRQRHTARKRLAGINLEKCILCKTLGIIGVMIKRENR